MRSILLLPFRLLRAVFALLWRHKWKSLTTFLLLSGIFAGPPLWDALKADPARALDSIQRPALYDCRDHLYMQWPEYGDNRPLTPADLPPHLLHAFIAREDQRFLSHGGVDFRGMGRAIFTDILHLRLKEGGSTITMQLADLTYDRPESSVVQKLRGKIFEVVMAWRIESLACKKGGSPLKGKHLIACAYMDRLPFSGGRTGLREAAAAYFDKEIKDLTLGECAYLAGLVRAPSANDAWKNSDNACAARDAVVRNMLRLRFITQAQADEAKFYTLPAPPSRARRGDGYTSAAVRRELGRLVEARLLPGWAPDSPDLKVFLTLDPALQDHATDLLRARLQRIESLRGYRRAGSSLDGTVVLLDNATGGIRAAVGGRNFSRFQEHLAFQARRLLASVAKVFVYASAMEAAGLTARSRLRGGELTPAELKGLASKPGLHSVLPPGLHSVEHGLAMSDNNMAIRAGLLTGMANYRRLLDSLSLPASPLPTDTSAFLGSFNVHPVDAAAAFSAIPRGGQDLQPYLIRSVEARGSVVYRHRAVPRAVFSPSTAREITLCLRATFRGQGTAARQTTAPLLRLLPAGKTGTADGNTDLWFAGFTPAVTGVVWIGHRNGNLPVHPGVSAGSTAFPLWRDLMLAAAR